MLLPENQQGLSLLLLFLRHYLIRIDSCKEFQVGGLPAGRNNSTKWLSLISIFKVATKIFRSNSFLKRFDFFKLSPINQGLQKTF